MAHKNKPFAAELRDYGIDPQAWASARAAETEPADYHLSRDLEDLIESAAYDRNVELNDNENLLDLFSILWTAMSRWPLPTPTPTA